MNVSFSTGLVYSSGLSEKRVGDTLSLSLAVGTQQGIHLEEFSILPKKFNCLHQGAQSMLEEIVPTYCRYVCSPDCGHLICDITQSTDTPSLCLPSVGGGGGHEHREESPCSVPAAPRSLLSHFLSSLLPSTILTHFLSFPKRNPLPMTMLSSLQGNFTVAPNTWACKFRERSLCLNPSQALTDYVPLGKAG